MNSPFAAHSPLPADVAKPGRLVYSTPSRPGLHPTVYRGTFHGQVRNLNGSISRWSVSTPLVKNSAKSAGGFFKALFLHVVNHNAERSEGPLKKRRRFPNVIGFY